jgi:hypothetical protein
MLLCHDNQDFTKSLTNHINENCFAPQRDPALLVREDHHLGYNRDDHDSFLWLEEDCRAAMVNCGALSPALTLVHLALGDQTLGSRTNKAKCSSKAWELIRVVGLQELPTYHKDEMALIYNHGPDRFCWREPADLRHAAMLRLLRNVLIHSDVDGTKKALKELGHVGFPEESLGDFYKTGAWRPFADHLEELSSIQDDESWFEFFDKVEEKIHSKRLWVWLNLHCTYYGHSTRFVDWFYKTSRDSPSLTLDGLRKKFQDDSHEGKINSVFTRITEDAECRPDDFFLHHRRSDWLIADLFDRLGDKYEHTLSASLERGLFLFKRAYFLEVLAVGLLVWVREKGSGSSGLDPYIRRILRPLFYVRTLTSCA